MLFVGTLRLLMSFLGSSWRLLRRSWVQCGPNMVPKTAPKSAKTCAQMHENVNPRFNNCWACFGGRFNATNRIGKITLYYGQNDSFLQMGSHTCANTKKTRTCVNTGLVVITRIDGPNYYFHTSELIRLKITSCDSGSLDQLTGARQLIWANTNMANGCPSPIYADLLHILSDAIPIFSIIMPTKIEVCANQRITHFEDIPMQQTCVKSPQLIWMHSEPQTISDQTTQESMSPTG